MTNCGNGFGKEKFSTHKEDWDFFFVAKEHRTRNPEPPTKGEGFHQTTEYEKPRKGAVVTN